LPQLKDRIVPKFVGRKRSLNARVLAARLQDSNFFRDRRNSKVRGNSPSTTPSPESFHRIPSSPSTINRNHGVRATRKASKPEAVQIFRCRPLARVAIRVEAILHKCRDKMLSHVDGAELDYVEWIRFRGGQPVDVAMV
jgi:hypothetical protein